MPRTWIPAGLAVILLGLVFLPRSSGAADWSFSTHRVQMADEPKPDQTMDAPTPTAVAGKKSIGKGVMFSLVIPGTGQLYANSWIRAVPWFVVEVAGWAMFAKYHGDGKNKTDEFESFAGPRRVNQAPLGHFDVNAYLLREWQIATSQQYNPTTPYTDDLSVWKSLDWSDRQRYFDNAPGYTHDVMTDDVQQYFEMIGKYINQFGFGWMDTYDPAAYDVNTPTQDHIWTKQYPGQPVDDPASAAFDGYSPWFYQYRDMRGDANKLLDKGNVAMEVVLVNHVLSALDAAFAIRSHNKHLEKQPLGGLKLHYDAKTMDGQWARVMTLTLPLN